MTTEVKRIVCLANSYKPGGRCLAGQEVLPDGRLGGWIRPVSARETREVTLNECRYEDGASPRVLDIVDVPVVEARPEGSQQENWLLASGHYWKKVGNLSVSDLGQFIDSPARLWVDGFSSFERLNNRVPYSVDNSILDSLRLIVVRRFALSEFRDNRNRRRLTGHFRHARQDYTLDITDPLFLDKYAEIPADSNITGERFLTVSLGEPFESYGHTYSYKLIAAIIEP